jgi:acyl transferase domain-containing protein/surfactin synthase thioesterase subunit/acyl carrier protein
VSGSRPGRAVAIVGIGCRFPGADDPATFWDNLCRGVESITFFSEEELVTAGVDPALLRDPSYVKAAPMLNNVDRFDAAFFGYSPREATIMDPQHRIFLEVARDAFEDAGYHPESYGGVVGVFAGGGGVVTSYLMAHRRDRIFPGQTAGIQHLGNDKDFLSTRVSYKLNLTGPSITVQTACSTSLVAVHLARQSLLRGECDLVIAGAATIRIPHVSGYPVEKGNVHSADGHCRAFDAAGQGTIFGSGVAAVLLKNLDDALRDGDHIYALIIGTAVNNDGGEKLSYAAPSVTGQARAMLDALSDAEVAPDTIGYVECHATGTVVGDPLEIQALTRAFRVETSGQGFCKVGSVKTNIGHPEQAAGLAGLIKTALALKHARIPPSLHFVTPNPTIDFETSPFRVNTELVDWPAAEHPRRAAVNSLGIGGTNAFAVLEEPPRLAEPTIDDRAYHVLTLSAKSEAALSAYAERCRSFLDAAVPGSLADYCYTTNVSRSAFAHRLALPASSLEQVRDGLATFAAKRTATKNGRRGGGARRVAFLFTGQGSQYPGMARRLYDAHPAFRRALDECDEGLRPHLERPLRDVLFPYDGEAGAIHETGWTQPALFAVEYALATLLRSWGIEPGAVIGHSVGELAAACTAGAFDLPDALRLVAERGQLMQSLPKQGAMAVVFATEARVRAALRSAKTVAVAALNGPENTVVSGDRDELAEVLHALARDHIGSKTLAVSHAFHSPLMEPILDRLEAVASDVRHHAPRITLISNVTGRAFDGPGSARYWREHARGAVRFADGITTLRELGYDVFIEIGPGRALLGMARQSAPETDLTWLATLGRQKDDWRTISESIAALYALGFNVDWPRVHDGAARRRVPFPTYPYQRKRYWLDEAAGDEGAAPGDAGSPRTESVAIPRADHPLLGVCVRSDGDAIEFESQYGVEQLPYLRDHRVYGRPVLPTAVGLEAAIAAGRAHFGDAAVQVEEFVYHEPLIVNHGGQHVRLVLRVDGAERAAFRLLGKGAGANAAWRTHMSGMLVRVRDAGAAAGETAERFVPDATRAVCASEIRPDDYYAAVSRIGLEYGPSFRGVAELRYGQASVVAKVRLPAGISLAAYALHPSFVDACLHVYFAAIGEVGNGARPSDRGNDTYLPIGVARFRVHREHVSFGWSHAVVRNGDTRAETVVVDIRVYDGDGRPVATLEGLSLRRLSRTALGAARDTALGGALYRVRWDEKPPGKNPQGAARGRWLVFADRGGVGAALAEVLENHGDGCELVFSDALGIPPVAEDIRRVVEETATAGGLPCRGVVYLWGLDSPSLLDMSAVAFEETEAVSLGGALFVTQAVVGARSSMFEPRVWFATRNAQAAGPSVTAPIEAMQAALWGFGRTVALEHPALWGGLIDLAASAASPRDDAGMIAGELLGSDREDQVAFRDGRRLVARLGRVAPGHRRTPSRVVRDDATYLVTGGTGSLGLRVARWLVEEQGARSVVLVGRRGADGHARGVVGALTARGATVDVVKADVSVGADVKRVIDEIRRLRPALRGLIHCAGVVDDGIIGQLDWQKFARATAPKIRGAWLLHQHTRDVELDFFVLYSSLLSLTGSAGQANYTAANAFLDALAAHRRQLGLSAMVVNWGPWADAGMATRTGERGAATWRARGTRFLAPDEGVAVLGQLMGDGVEQAAVTFTDWATYLTQFLEVPPLYADLGRAPAAGASSASVAPRQNVEAQLREAPSEDRVAAVLAVVRRHVTEELGFDESIDPGVPLNEVGLDSLMAVNVANRLERALGIAVPVAKLIRGPSMTELVTELFPDLVNGHDGDARVLPEEPPPPIAPEPGVEGSRPGVAASITVGDGWLVFPRPNPSAATRLFCFHYAGGGAATFRPWADTLDPSIELVAVDPPGRGARVDESPLRTFDEFMAELIPRVEPYLDRPFALFGHCLGALTALEAAHRFVPLARAPLVHLFVSGARPPHRLAHEGRFEEQLVRQLLTHPEFDPLRPSHEQPDDVFAEVIRHFGIDASDGFLQNAELRHLLLPAVRADFAMAFNHRTTPLPPWDAPLTCFIGLGDPYVSQEDALGWGRYTRVAFQLRLRETAHFLIVDDRDFIVDTVSRELRDGAAMTRGG